MMLQVRVESKEDYRVVEELTREAFSMFIYLVAKSITFYINSETQSTS